MNSESTSDDASNLDDFANLRDIIPSNVKDQNIPTEYLISENFLVPGVVTQYFDEQVLFKPYLSDETFNVPYNQIRYRPKVHCIHCTYEVGDKVEVYMLDAKLNLHGWAKSTIKSNAKDTYVVTLEQRNALVIVQGDKIRAIAKDAYLNDRYLYTFDIPIPQELQNFASNIEVHDYLCETIGNPHISYDFDKNVLVISSNNAECEGIAKMLLEMHFENLTQRMLLTESINELEVKFQRMKTEDLLEQFQVHPDMLKYIIGKQGKNIRKAKTIPGVTFIAVLKDTNTVKIYAQNEAALKKASSFLQLDKEIIQISNETIAKVIGKHGQTVQEIADKSNLRHIVIISSKNPASEFTELELIGTSSSIADAKCLLKFHLDDLQGFNKLVQANDDVNQQSNTVFGDKNTKSTLESPAEGVPSYKLTRRIITGRNYLESINCSGNVKEQNVEPELINFTENQDLIFYNENRSRGRAGISSRGRSNAARRSRSRFGYQSTQSSVDDSKGKNETDQTVKQFQQSTTNRGRSRGRGRGRAGLALALIRDVNSISSRESQNDSSTDEYNEQVEIQPLLEAGDASTTRDEQELEIQRKQGQRVPRNMQQRNKPGSSSHTSKQTALENKSWHGKRWRQKIASSSDMQTWNNLSKVYFGKSSTNNSTEATGDSAAPEDDYEEI